MAHPTSTTDPTAPLRDAMRLVADTRRDLADITAQLAERQKAFDAANAELVGAKVAAANLLSVAETTLRQGASSVLTAHPGLPLPKGLGKRTATVLHYDHDKAFQFAQEKNLCLQLNQKAFEALAKTQQLPFVEITYVDQITIATDLDAALAHLEVAS